MKKSEFKIQIRQIVREEVARAIHEVITELKEPAVEEQPQTQQPKKKKVIGENKHYSSNSVLNKILNETANDDSDWETMGGGTQTINNMSNVLQRQYSSIAGGTNDVPLPTEDINGKPVTNISDTLMDNLTKDYSGMIKSMEKASKQSRGI